MDEILKMVRFDYISVKNLTAQYVFGFIGLSFLMALFHIPLGLLCIPAAVMLFAPVQTIAGSECKKLYGMLPVSRSAVTRAMFAEIIVPLFIGEILAFIFLIASRYLTLYKVILPEKSAKYFSNLFRFSGNGAAITYPTLSVLITFVFLGLTLLACYAEMKAETKSMGAAVRDVLLIIIVLITVVITLSVLSYHQIIPSFADKLIPSSAAGKIMLGIVLNIAAIAGGLLFCELTVRKTADREL